MKLGILTLALLLGFIAITALVSDTVLAQRAAKNRLRVAGIDRWYVFVSPDGDFTLSFQQRPDREPD